MLFIHYLFQSGNILPWGCASCPFLTRCELRWLLHSRGRVWPWLACLRSRIGDAVTTAPGVSEGLFVVVGECILNRFVWGVRFLLSHAISLDFIGLLLEPLSVNEGCWLVRSVSVQVHGLRHVLCLCFLLLRVRSEFSSPLIHFCAGCGL